LPAPVQTDLSPLLGFRGIVGTLVLAVNNGMQNMLITVFTYSSLRAVFEVITRTPIGASRWTIAAKMRIGAGASDSVYVGCVLVITAVNSAMGGGPAIARAVETVQAVGYVLLVVLVMLRLGIFATAVMLFTSAL